MMMGSLEQDIAEANTAPTDLPEVVNDFDIEGFLLFVATV